MRVDVQTVFRIGNLHLIEQLQNSRAHRITAQTQMRAQHFTNLHLDREARIQAGHGVLKNHRNVFADDRAPRCRADGLQIGVVEQ